MADEKKISRELEIKLESWNNLNSWACNIEDAIQKLITEKNRDYSWAIMSLVSEHANICGQRAIALHEMRPLGVEDAEAALALAAKTF